MDNRKGMQNQGQGQGQGQNNPNSPNTPTDKGEDAEDRRDAAQRAWNDRAGVPRGTPEQGDQSSDQVGGVGSEKPEPEIKKQSDAPTTRTPSKNA